MRLLPRAPAPAPAEPARLDRPGLDAALAGLGPAGETAERLDAAAQAGAAALRSLSELTSRLAIDYLERIVGVRNRSIVGRVPGGTPAALTLAHGVAVTTGGYAAHMAVERDATAFGVIEVPVLGTLPAPRNGRPPQDLLLRVVKTTRRPFPSVRAVSDEVWSGLVDCATWRAHERAGPDTPPLDPAVVDALLRFGWVLRQVDLHYGLSPESAGGTE